MKKTSKMPKATTDIPGKIQSAIYPVVLKLFSENDFHQVKIKDISDLSGISTATIYKYFSSKESLVVKVLEDNLLEIRDQSLIHVEGLESTREKWRKLFWVALNHYDSRKGLAVLYFITVPTKTWMQNELWIHPPGWEALFEVIAVGKTRGEIDKSVSANQILGQFYMNLERAVQIWFIKGMKWKLVESIDRFFPVFWKAIS